MDSTGAGRSLRVVIIGGGISGLSAAWYLEKQAAAHEVTLKCTLLEEGDRWGGKVLTDKVDDFTETPFVVEAGPDSFLTQKPWALQLACELGLDERLLGTNDAKRHVFVLNQGKPLILPDGVLLIVPTKFKPFALSPLISPLGKLRMGLDLLIPAKTGDEDETLADFVRRRLGKEALDKIAEPLMSGIYNAEADKLSVLATFPRFRALEKQYRSLIRGMIASRRKPATAAAPSAYTTGGRQVSTFMSLYGGTNELVNALVSQLNGDLRLRAQVNTVQRVGDQYALRLTNDETINADVVIVATPSFVAADLLSQAAPQAVECLKQIRYLSTGTLSLAYKESDILQPLDGFGLVIPRSEDRPINAITISSTKFDKRAPAGYVLMRVFFGGSRSPQTMQLDDPTLVKTVRSELQAILGISAEPLFHRIYRWWNASPQYDLGHLSRVDAIEAALPPGLYVTGSPYRGVGIPDCVHQSQMTAESVFQAFTEQVISH